jgi:hypothetical protein
MQLSNLPGKFNIPFASSAGGGFIRTIPQVATGVPGQASLQAGFPPETFEPVAAGGTPPFGSDFNGVLNQITAWNQWVSAGRIVLPYDATFQTAIGGYPIESHCRVVVRERCCSTRRRSTTTSPTPTRVALGGLSGRGD